ncbi:hypothetical protein [Lentibacillus cibarius]|uniref:Uncharacterized protein n=1 Tax=Lentibacillus cibarius TaxID=2583219 RepID=A0A5S3QGF5_9BACI|nr:hypothetical protein [Lentibacillus cibarius]TMN20970.1 hypothetical protein FFL34_01715 [Lentibacillus cibarius]
MKKRLLMLAIVPVLCIGIFIYIWQTSTSPAITYFEEDKETNYHKTSTYLKLLSEESRDSYEVGWNSQSVSERELYLRQDVSLLFHNGRLRGVKSKWKENASTIKLKEKVTGEDSNYYQAITYHHGEVHYPDDRITSIQQMSYDQLYVIDSPNTALRSFKKAESDFEYEWKRLLRHTTQQQLAYSWNQLMEHFQVDKSSYRAVPLTALKRFNQEALPSFTPAQTNQIIGQLWEGLYKNYIIPLVTSKSKSETLTSYTPVILFDKQKTHLMVLYEINGEKKRLIQKYPAF